MSFTPTPHPVWPIPTPAQAAEMGSEKWKRYMTQREERIANEKLDPYRHGYEPEVWSLARQQLAEPGIREILALGGNRGSKSEFAGKLVMQTLVEKEGRKGWCFQSSESNSRAMQQPILWNYMPREWRNVKKGRTANISYTQKNGFSDNTFVLPNSSQNWFRNYSQDEDKIEGGELDIIWCDELVPAPMLETLRYRLVTRGGILIVTFTPIEGYTATVKGYLNGAVTLLEVPAELLPIYGPDGETIVAYEKVPRIQQPQRRTARIVYFHTQDNPFGGYTNIKKTLEGAPRTEILCRAYGVPTKAIANRFPKFNDKVHVIPLDRVPAEGTDYQIVDPCGGRNWFMTWIRVDIRGRMFVIHEWPCPSCYIEGVGLPGDWAEPDGKKHDGKRGPAQTPFGFGLTRYKTEILKIEAERKIGIFERSMDSRYGNSATIAKEAATTLIQECAALDLHFASTPGDNIDEGIDMINTRLDYDHTRPIEHGNEPTLYIASHCANTIYALHEWTGMDGRHGACKDPIDNLRYAVLGNVEYVGPHTLHTHGGGSY